MATEEIKIEISPEVSKGTYSNVAILSHSATELILDFGQILPGTNKTIIRDRILMNPVHAKELLRALSENLQKYEEKFGEIVNPALTQNGNNRDNRQGNIPFKLEPLGEA